MTVLTVRRMGNSLGVVIPNAQAKQLDLHAGDRITVDLRKEVGLESIIGAMAGQFGDIDALMREMDEGDD